MQMQPFICSGFRENLIKTCFSENILIMIS